jgi:hypothetical protein
MCPIFSEFLYLYTAPLACVLLASTIFHYNAYTMDGADPPRAFVGMNIIDSA